MENEVGNGQGAQTATGDAKLDEPKHAIDPEMRTQTEADPSLPTSHESSEIKSEKAKREHKATNHEIEDTTHRVRVEVSVMQRGGLEDEGAGWLDVNVHKIDKTCIRLVVYNDSTDRITVDEPIWLGTTFQLDDDERTITFVGWPQDSGWLPFYFMKVEEVEAARTLHAALEAYVPKSRIDPMEEPAAAPVVPPKDDAAEDMRSNNDAGDEEPEEEPPEEDLGPEFVDETGRELKFIDRDTEETVHRVRAKIFVRPLADGPDGLPEVEKGIGWLTVNVNKSNKSVVRLVVYEDSKDRVILDEPLYVGMELQLQERQRTIQFATETREGLTNFVTVRVSSRKIARAAHEAMQARVPTTPPDPDWEDPIGAVANALKVWEGMNMTWNMKRFVQ